MALPAAPAVSGFFGGSFAGGGGFGGGGFGGGGFGGGGGIASGGTREPAAPLLIEFTSADTAALGQMKEDLTIMSHILDQAVKRSVGDEQVPSPMGVPLIYTAGGRSVWAMHIEGFGALFTVNVGFPLLAPPNEAEARPAQKPVASEWEAARRAVLGEDNGGEALAMPEAASETPFDAGRVDAVKQALISALKNASNIRGLKSDDYVSVAVFGQPMKSIGTVAFAPPVGDEDPLRSGSGAAESLPPTSSSARRSTGGAAGVAGQFSRAEAGYGRAWRAFRLAAADHPGGTMLTLRVKKSVVNALAAGEISAAEFAKAVSVNTYAGTSHGPPVQTWRTSPRF
jgi:hypothetical protein